MFGQADQTAAIRGKGRRILPLLLRNSASADRERLQCTNPSGKLRGVAGSSSSCSSTRFVVRVYLAVRGSVSHRVRESPEAARAGDRRLHHLETHLRCIMGSPVA